MRWIIRRCCVEEVVSLRRVASLVVTSIVSGVVKMRLVIIDCWCGWIVVISSSLIGYLTVFVFSSVSQVGCSVRSPTRLCPGLRSARLYMLRCVVVDCWCLGCCGFLFDISPFLFIAQGRRS